MREITDRVVVCLRVLLNRAFVYRVKAETGPHCNARRFWEVAYGVRERCPIEIGAVPFVEARSGRSTNGGRGIEKIEETLRNHGFYAFLHL